MEPLINTVRFVLVGTLYPGNIGSAARAMKTMGFSQLYLVNPKEFPSEKALRMATEAADVLERAIVVDSLDQALDDCVLTVATSTRSRSGHWPILNPSEAAVKLNTAVLSGPVALVFGPEPSGLSSRDLYQCQFQATIPTSAACSSLNLAQAVQIFAYALFNAAPEQPVEPPVLATHQQLQHFFRSSQNVLESINFPKGDSDGLMVKLKRLLGHQQWAAKDLHLLQGIMERIVQKLERSKE